MKNLLLIASIALALTSCSKDDLPAGVKATDFGEVIVTTAGKTYTFTVQDSTKQSIFFGKVLGQYQLMAIDYISQKKTFGVMSRETNSLTAMAGVLTDISDIANNTRLIASDMEMSLNYTKTGNRVTGTFTGKTISGSFKNVRVTIL